MKINLSSGTDWKFSRDIQQAFLDPSNESITTVVYIMMEFMKAEIIANGRDATSDILFKNAREHTEAFIKGMDEIELGK